MNALRNYVTLVRMQLQMWRDQFVFMLIVQAAFTIGIVLGFGYIIPDISKTAAFYLTTGTATQAVVTVGLVMLPQILSQAKAEGRLDYFLSLPISREAYLFSQVTIVAVIAVPGAVAAIAFGAWYYDLTLHISPLILVVVPLSILSLAGFGVMIAMVSPYQQLTNIITQLVIFYVLLFAPVLIPQSQLPWLLRHTADFMPPTYSADGIRATVTNLPGTHLARSLIVMTGFGLASVAISSFAIRRRG
jgi:ABC-2 type transport system permease protein